VTEPLVIGITATILTDGRHVTHVLELAQARIVVDVDRDIAEAHRRELVCILGRLQDVMGHLWREGGEDGDAYVMDLRREAP
jgi:hypothetical protein